MRRVWSLIFSLLLVIGMLSGCEREKEQNAETDKEIKKTDTSGMDFTFDESDTVVETPQNGVEIAEDENETITTGGVYTINGKKEDQMILVDADGEEVTLILDGVTIQNSKGPAIYIRAAKKVTLTLAEGTVSTLSDGASYAITDQESTLDAAIFSKADLTINGIGSLEVHGNYKHGIVSKDDLVFSSGNLTVDAQNVALNGKDCVKINGGSMTLSAGSDGIRSDNTEDPDKGYVYLYGGTVSIHAGNDGVQAETVINVENVDLKIKSGGGSGTSLSTSNESYKGLKAGSDIYISGGTFELESQDDCIHSNGTITISGGSYSLASGDDGVHADTDLEISGDTTTLNISKSYEGIEATDLVITGGTISITAQDDGLNAAGGNNGTAGGDMMRPGMGQFSSSTGSIKITGGNLYIAMDGDGIDANGTLEITGGNIVVSGANRGDTAILDFDSSGVISGGNFVGTGAIGMAQNFSSNSTQGVMMVSTGSQSVDAEVKLTDKNGNTLISYTAEREFSNVILSCSAIKNGESYDLVAGSYTATITMNGTVYGNSGGMGGMGGHMGGPMGGMGGPMGGKR